MNKFLIYNDKVKKFENIINNYTLAFHITNILLNTTNFNHI